MQSVAGIDNGARFFSSTIIHHVFKHFSNHDSTILRVESKNDSDSTILHP